MPEDSPMLDFGRGRAEPADPLLERLLMAQTASCNCDVKTPVIACHASMCRYRLFAEAYAEIARLRVELAGERGIARDEQERAEQRRFNW